MNALLLVHSATQKEGALVDLARSLRIHVHALHHARGLACAVLFNSTRYGNPLSSFSLFFSFLCTGTKRDDANVS